jgi:hypothetical protein
MHFGFVALLAAAGGAGAAAWADTKHPDKAVTIPGINVTAQPGAIIGAAGIAVGLLFGVPAFVALGAGSGLYEAGTAVASRLLPDGGGGGQLPPGGAVAGFGYDPPLRGYEVIGDDECVEAIANMNRG